MRRTRFKNLPCSVARTADLLGDWWTPLVMRECFYGTRRFDDFQENLQIGRNVLTQRLKRMVDEGILRRQLYQERPKRYEYRLTQKGREFFGVVCAMMRWGDDWLADGGPPVELRSRETGEIIRPVVVDENTGKPVDIRGVYVTAGPSMPEEYRDHPRFNRDSDPR